MWNTLIATHDLGRLQTLAATLVRYGFGDLVRAAWGWGTGHAAAHVRVRHVLAAEFSRLQSAMPSVSFEAIRAEMTQALGMVPEPARSPLAADRSPRSNRAHLHGREVVARVRRPGIRPMIETDLMLSHYAASKTEKKRQRFRSGGGITAVTAAMLV